VWAARVQVASSLWVCPSHQEQEARPSGDSPTPDRLASRIINSLTSGKIKRTCVDTRFIGVLVSSELCTHVNARLLPSRWFLQLHWVPGRAHTDAQCINICTKTKSTQIHGDGNPGRFLRLLTRVRTDALQARCFAGQTCLVADSALHARSSLEGRNCGSGHSPVPTHCPISPNEG